MPPPGERGPRIAGPRSDWASLRSAAAGRTAGGRRRRRRFPCRHVTIELNRSWICRGQARNGQGVYMGAWQARPLPCWVLPILGGCKFHARKGKGNEHKISGTFAPGPSPSWAVSSPVCSWPLLVTGPCCWTIRFVLQLRFWAIHPVGEHSRHSGLAVPCGGPPAAKPSMPVPPPTDLISPRDVCPPPPHTGRGAGREGTSVGDPREMSQMTAGGSLKRAQIGYNRAFILYP